MNTTSDDSREKMLQLNLQQKDFYESRYEADSKGVKEERAANRATNLWTVVRLRLNRARRDAGVEELLLEKHKQWMSNIGDAHILDLGCFKGNFLSLWMAERCKDYTGLDLSEQAIEALNGKLKARGFDDHARAIAHDFLANDFPDNSFDVVYAFSVMHHFEDINVVMAEVRRVLKPGGVLITMDPLQTDPVNWLARQLYRPFQTDKAWEWPFSKATIRLFQKYFELADMQGLQGAVKLGYPLQAVPGLGGLGRAVCRAGLSFDQRFGSKLGIPFYMCWHATLLLRKPLK
jgi:ubiquinone/menaquinone biosynthesis C-methylase UbiE